MILRAFVLGLLTIASFAHASVRLTLPPAIYAVPGVEMNVFFGNTVLIDAADAANVSFRCECPVGKVAKDRWTLNAKDTEVGRHAFKLTATDAQGNIIEIAETEVIVSPRDEGNGINIKLLIVGDSLTHASHYPNEIARLLNQPKNPTWQMYGTHHPPRAKEGVNHEGYGGWSWVRFRTKFEPKRPTPGKTNSSPFVFADENGKPKTDVTRYFKEYTGGKRPDLIIIMLGINDCFSAKPDSPATIDVKIDWMFREADLLLKDIRKAAPRADIGICLTTPGNSRDGAFVANYGKRYTRWGWRRIQHRLVERQIEHFQNTWGIHLIPTNLNLDTTDGYPPNNGVHPNEKGYQQIGATIYSWMKSKLRATSF